MNSLCCLEPEKNMTVDSMEEEDAEVAKLPSAVARKLRRKLKPISPDKILSDDELATSDELGFGDILTRRSVSTGSSKDSDEEKILSTTEQKTALLSHEQHANENDNTHLTAQQRNAATTLNGSQCMTQYSSITNPMTSTTTTADATAQMNNLSFLQAEISMETSRDDGIIGEEDNGNSNEDIIDTNNNSKISGKRVTIGPNDIVLSPIKGGNSSQETLVTKQLNTSLMKNDTETLKSFITTHYEDSDWKDLPENAKEAAKKLGYNEEMWDSNEEPECCDEYWGDLGEEQRRAAEVLGYTKETWDTDTDDESISFGSSSSSEESSASDIPVAVLNEESTTQLQQLQSEISHRRRLLAKLLRGKEGSAYALMVQGQEDFVNSRLLDKEANDAAANATDDTSNTRRRKDPIRTIKSMLMDEYYHTLPGAFSLVIHCLLYITVYAIISKLMTWLCDVIILYIRGGGANTNWFDCTNYEHLFYGIVLILSLIASRVTGIVFDWNENRAYQKRVAFQVRNKWYLKCWDALLMNFFHGGELQEKYDNNTKDNNCISERCEKEKTVQHKRKMWGPRIKYVLDLISFFVCYKCIDYFVYSLGTAPSSDITELVLEKLPSRQLQEQSSGVHSVETGVSYACESVMKALDNPYAVDMLNMMIASSPLQSDEASNMILNAKKCGWSSGTETVAEEEEGITGDDLWGHTISALDNKYIQEALSDGAYYDLVGDPNPRIFDPAMEMMFLIASTSICFGLLYAFGIPFMLI